MLAEPVQNARCSKIIPELTKLIIFRVILMTSTFMIHHLTSTLTYTTLLNITYNHTKCIHNVNIIQYK